jgi:hypothetical protein
MTDDRDQQFARLQQSLEIDSGIDAKIGAQMHELLGGDIPSRAGSKR